MPGSGGLPSPGPANRRVCARGSDFPMPQGPATALPLCLYKGLGWPDPKLKSDEVRDGRTAEIKSGGLQPPLSPSSGKARRGQGDGGLNPWGCRMGQKREREAWLYSASFSLQGSLWSGGREPSGCWDWKQGLPVCRDQGSTVQRLGQEDAWKGDETGYRVVLTQE